MYDVCKDVFLNYARSNHKENVRIFTRPANGFEKCRVFEASEFEKNSSAVQGFYM